MRTRLGWLRAHVWGLAVGALVTTGTVGLYLSREFEPYSLALLDYKFRRFNPIKADPRVVLIDINDYAVEHVHRWPWPRRKHAELVSTLRELGAGAILMDLVFDSGEAGQINHPQLNADHEVDRVDSANLTGECNLSDAEFGDRQFTDALGAAGNVFLGIIADTYDPAYRPDAVRGSAHDIIRRAPNIALGEFEVQMRSQMEDGVDWRPVQEGRASELRDRQEILDRLRIEFLLDSDFGLERGEISTRLGLTDLQVMRSLADAKRSVARRRVAHCRDRHKDITWPETFAEILPGREFENNSDDRYDLLRAFRAVSSEINSLRTAISVNDSLLGRIRNTDNFTLPLDKFTEVAKVGLVAFDTDAADGIVRRLPLVANYKGHMVKHLGFAVACDVLDIDEESIRLEDNDTLVMESRRDGRQRRIQIDARGRTLINWHTDPEKPGNWQRSFVHIPVAHVMTIAKHLRYIEEDEGREAILAERYVRLSSGQAHTAVTKYAELVRRRKDLRRRRDRDGSDELNRLEEKIREIERASIANVQEQAAGIRKWIDGGGSEAELDDVDRTFYTLGSDDAITALERQRAQTERTRAQRLPEVQTLIETLRPRVEGKVCLVGYTASAIADMVNTPVFDEVPGVMAHANVINTMLIDRFPRSLPSWFDILLIVMVGVPVTFVTTWRGPIFSLLMMFLVLASLWVAAVHVFEQYTLHVDIIGPLVAGFLSWVFVTLYRQLTEERQKRAFSKSLAQYTSPAIATKLAEQLSRQSGTLDLSPRARQVTCFFSDLKGFTSISERLGAARTRDVLNPYLEAMSDVLIRSNAMINKFMGDGIFAFYNPPVLPVENHAEAACEATLGSFVALEELKKTLAKGDLTEEVNGFRMRIGVNTGEVFVGDYGSSNKLDYTCIGDTVNLSARLEPACKPFGIEAMISESTLKAAGDAYVVRHLGGLQVVGKKVGVQVYELIGRKGEVENDVIEYADLFGEAVTRFQNRDWDSCLRIIAECRNARPNDKALDLLEHNARQHQQSPPPEDWNQSIELTSK